MSSRPHPATLPRKRHLGTFEGTRKRGGGDPFAAALDRACAAAAANPWLVCLLLCACILTVGALEVVS